ncbi:MAG: DNA polymerase III subunit gamma/tau [Acidobacteria bacterium]|nr:DNA polymerase III subunit gamma/tau [Acidobacteriota bacterium]
MSYQVIARKWRPQAFEEVTGQEAITRTLRNAITGNRLHHAFLFAGPRGVGKTTTARLLAKALNCQSGPTATPCGQCPSCLEVTNGNSIDVLEIDAASHTGVDNIRDVIISTVANRPARDRYKIFIIDEVHMLSISAFNALLKTLEEPPSHVIFIMATTELHKVPETILSRCQQFEFRTISTEKIAERLRLIGQAEHITISQDALLRIASAGRGSMRDAQSAFDQVIAFTGTTIEEKDVLASLGMIGPQFVGQVIDALVARDGKHMLTLVDELVRTGYDLRQFLHEVMTYLRHMLVFQAAGADSELLPVSESEGRQIEQHARTFSSEDLVRFFTLLTDVEQSLRTAPEPRFQLEFGLVKLTQLAHLKSLETLLAQLEKLIGTGGMPSPAPSTPPTPASPSGSGGRGPAAPSGSRGNPPPAPSRPLPPPRPQFSGTSAIPVAPPQFSAGSTPPPAPPRPTFTPPSLPPEITNRIPVAQTARPALAPTVAPAAIAPSPSDEPSTPNLPPWMDDLTAPPPEPPDDFDESPTLLPPPTQANSGVRGTQPPPVRPPLSLVATPDQPVSRLDLKAEGALEILRDRLSAEFETSKKPLLLMTLDKMVRVELDGTEVGLILPPDAVEAHKQLSLPPNLMALQDALRRITGMPYRPRIKFEKTAASRPTALSESDVTASRSRHQAESDPVVQALLQTFRGELTQVKPG